MIRRLLPLAALLLAARPAAAQQPTVKPGMSLAEVKAAWGEPLATRERSGYTYLIYRSDCMPKCGTQDVVILHDGKVVDGIARSSNRHFEGGSLGRAPANSGPAGAGKAK